MDLFYNNQPTRTFENDLREYEIPVVRKVNVKSNDLISINGVDLDFGVFGSDKALSTAFTRLEKFLKTNTLYGGEYRFTIKKDEKLKNEQFVLDIDEKCCTAFVGTADGARRAIIHFEDLLVIGGGNLKKGKVSINTEIELRLARCFFAPINRPPRNLAELDDNVDYYPDAYLDRLMRDGANAVWVYADLDNLVKSSYIKEFGVDSEKRIKKLNAVIEKCALYGIKVYLFTIAPMSLDEFSMKARYPGIEKEYPQVYGNALRGPKGFCTYSDFGKKYLEETIENLVKSAPKLGGIISITFGERVTHCGNTWPDLEGVWSNTCPHCGDKTQMQIVAHTAKIIKDAIDRVNPEVEFISWTYGHRGQPLEKIAEYVARCPENVSMLQNFEDDGRVLQLGKKRFALDYYLSYAGPSEMFKHTAVNATSQNKKIYAKMQVCCSHEIATVPYIPVPGIIYDKLTRAKQLGVTGIMESWLFGNYPCLMSKAVGMLSSDYKYESKKDFLIQLASLYWSEEDAKKVALAWDYFEKGYENYPINVMFNYYGPMHDGVVWELSLMPKNNALSRTWQLVDRPNGDRIGECLFEGHTIDEAITLCEMLSENWQKGLYILQTLSNIDKANEEQVSVAKALGILFDSGLNILRFYKLRNDLGYSKGDLRAILSQMKDIVYVEIENSKKMIVLCEKDNRLGYHSEAEGYKFFPEKLKVRIDSLESLLKDEFDLVEKRIDNNESPLPYYLGEQKGTKSVNASRNGLEGAEWAYLDDGASKFRISVGEYIEIEIKSEKKENFCFDNEFVLNFPDATMVVRHDGKIKPYIEAGHQSLLDEKAKEEVAKWKVESLSQGGGTHLILKIKKEDTKFIRLPYKFLISSYSDAKWTRDENPIYTLGKCLLSPNDFGWIK